MKGEYDYIVIGSGFGGSVAALRLAEKGYKVLVIEKGSWKKAEDFPKTNWNLRRWLWLPFLGFKGIFKMTFLRHLSVISGVGVGGGSLVYANTLPKPKSNFFNSGSWKDILDWQSELAPYYELAYKMLGANKTPELFDADLYLRKTGQDFDSDAEFENTIVGVTFGEKNKIIADPYFDGEGPDRQACDYCGRCMTGCPSNAKNSLDKNYLHLAQKRGAEILADHFVKGIKPLKSGGYIVEYRKTAKYLASVSRIKTKGVVLAGGVLGTVPLLLKLKATTMPELSDMVGRDVRSNNEALIFVTSTRNDLDMSKGVAIGSILKTGQHSHLEPVRYGSGSGFWRIGVLPLVTEEKWLFRIGKMILELIKNPLKWLKVYTVKDFAKHTSVLLYMEDLEGKLAIKKSTFGYNTTLQDGEPPSAFLPKAHKLARKYAENVNGKAMSFVLENLSGIPSTAHILGGAVIGKDKSCGVINEYHEVYGYKNFYICDGSAISANPGVNPALTITAMTERAMDKIMNKKDFSKN